MIGGSTVSGGFQLAIDLWNPAILQKILYNSGTWTDIPREAEEMMEEMRYKFVRRGLHLRISTPKVDLLSETSLLSIQLRVQREKLLLVHLIRGLREGSLAKIVYNKQAENG